MADDERPDDAATASRTSRGAARRTRTTSTSPAPTAGDSSTARAASRPARGGGGTRRRADALATGGVREGRADLARRVPRRRVAAVPPATGARGEHVALVRPLHPAARDPAHRRDPAPEAHARRPQPAVPTAARVGPPPARATSAVEHARGARARRRRSGPAGLTYEQIAEQLRAEFEDEATITKSAVAALLRRDAAETASDRPPRRAVAADGALRPHDHPRRAQGRAALEPSRPQRRRRRHSPVGRLAARSHRPKAWTAEQLRAFLDYVAESRYLPAWIFLATSGCRRGECLGLRWSDVDLDERTAIISRQVTALDHRGDRQGAAEDEAGHLIRLDSGTVAMLRRLRAEQAEEKLRLGPGYDDEGYVFCQFDGRPHHPERFSREFDRKQQYFNRDHPDAAAPDDHAPRPPPHLGDPRARRRHRHQDRQRAPQPQQHPHHARDLHPRDAADAERRGLSTVAVQILPPSAPIIS